MVVSSGEGLGGGQAQRTAVRCPRDSGWRCVPIIRAWINPVSASFTHSSFVREIFQTCCVGQERGLGERPGPRPKALNVRTRRLGFGLGARKSAAELGPGTDESHGKLAGDPGTSELFNVPWGPSEVGTWTEVREVILGDTRAKF